MKDISPYKVGDRAVGWFGMWIVNPLQALAYVRLAVTETHLVRAALLPLIVFELLNFSGWLHVSTEPIWLGLLATSLGSSLVYEAWRWYRSKYHLTALSLVVVAMAIGVVYLDAAGNVFEWYSSVFHFDKIVHFASGLVTASFFFSVFLRVAELRGWRLPLGWIAYLAVTFALLLGLGFEVVEFFADRYYGSNFWLGSGADTLTDILMDLAGGTAAILGMRLLAKEYSRRVSLRH